MWSFSNTIAEGAVTKTVGVASVPQDEMALDIGPETLDIFRNAIHSAGTIVWNGPMGVFEIKEFQQGTYALAIAVAQSTGFSLVGGGDSIGCG